MLIDVDEISNASWALAQAQFLVRDPRTSFELTSHGDCVNVAWYGHTGAPQNYLARRGRQPDFGCGER
jgi:hypothetical protein